MLNFMLIEINMVETAVVFLFFAILLQSVPLHQAIRCLECNSQTNSMCAYPSKFNKETITKNIPVIDCGHGIINKDGSVGTGAFFCRKVIQRSLSGSGEESVSRGCGLIRSVTPCHTEAKPDLKANVTTCQCFTNYCNGAAAHAVLLSLTVGAIAVYVVL